MPLPGLRADIMDIARHRQKLVHDDGVNAWRMDRFAPPADLCGLIDGYTDYSERTAGFTTRRELPHAEGVLIVNLGEPVFITGGDGGTIKLAAGEAFVAGAHMKSAFSTSPGSQAGLHVHLPLATLRLMLKTPMDELADRVVPLDAIVGQDARDLGSKLVDAKDDIGRISLMDKALRQLLLTTPALGPQQRYALELLSGRPELDISAIAAEIGWSRKHMADRVRDAVGVGPRAFRRLLRFQTLTRLINTSGQHPDWAGLAVDAGYYDQSHMIREFGEFGGITPREFIARALPDGGGLFEA